MVNNQVAGDVASGAYRRGMASLGRLVVYDRLRAKDPVSWSEIPNNRVFTGCDDVRDAFLAGRLSADRAAVILGQGRQQGLSRSFKIRAPGDKQ